MRRSLDIGQRVLTQFRVHVHQLIREGYSRMSPPQYTTWKEPDITGELCRHIQAFLESPTSPAWVIRYAIHDDPKKNVEGKMGESRPRIDIEFEMTIHGPRPRFPFEAKRLGPQHSVGMYLGPDGLEALLEGYYPLTHLEAGMLAYMQSHDYPHWINKMKNTLQGNVSKYRLADTKDYFPKLSIVNELNTHLTTHSDKNAELKIWHTFLVFH